ncbi:MAG: hypothetical protein IKM72_16190 [Oscillospiraceae bacterium]|nr:hypothetical protein [Oscillospiraceae bacterium]
MPPSDSGFALCSSEAGCSPEEACSPPEGACSSEDESGTASSPRYCLIASSVLPVYPRSASTILSYCSGVYSVPAR